MTHGLRWELTFVAVLAAALLPVGPARAGVVDGGIISLQVGQHRYWDAPTISSGDVPGYRNGVDSKNPDDDCLAHGAGPCFEYTVQIPEGGARLRVAIDLPDHRKLFALELYAPDGSWVGERWPYENAGGNGGGEISVWDHPTADAPRRPEGGDWTVRVLPMEITSAATFRLRAMLERQPTYTEHGRLLEPDLRAEPPHDFTFRAGILGVREGDGTPHSCLPDEIADAAAGGEGLTRCLRFSFGYQNSGAGPYVVRLIPRATEPTRADVVQRVYRNDATPWVFADNDLTGAYVDMPAGTATFHDTHGHWHYDNIFAAQLYRVSADGSVVSVGAAEKRGACAHDWVLVDWRRTTQAPQGAHDSGDRCDSVIPVNNVGEGRAVALSAGWADVYPYAMPDNYVAFDGQPDGTYLLRTWIDIDGLLTEIHEDNNTGYALIEVAGDTITLLERGRGSSPWDPDRIVTEELGE